MAGKMGAVRRPWTRPENFELKQLIECGTPRSSIAHKMGRTPESIKRHASKLGLAPRLNQNNLNGVPWTDEEKAILEAGWLAGTHIEVIAAALPNRSKIGIHRYASVMGLRRPARVRKGKSRVKTCFNGPLDLTEESSWRRECEIANERFCQAMEANPSERPTNLPEERQGYVRRIGMRFPSRPPSWSSMGDVV
jgi:hypothetical protein